MNETAFASVVFQMHYVLLYFLVSGSNLVPISCFQGQKIKSVSARAPFSFSLFINPDF